MILLQISSAQGPDECMLAVSKALERFIQEADELNVNSDILEEERGPRSGTLRSVLIAIQGGNEQQLLERWNGTIKWVCDSPWRKGGSRKNWFIGVTTFAPIPKVAESEIRFETLKASGPGGQHVNKTESAVRAVHVASGISIKVQSERSQHANRRLACMLLEHRLQQVQNMNQAQIKSERRSCHHQIERGNAVRTFIGMKFIPQA
ncbi:peptide chain release factor H [Xenorhabdus szentirmaii]|uniref:Peptide chain release factor (Modular protein) n=1 Tax=Xenorhabdus szentirmaii DSM 16338 TaxID=1427518 RepID=W1IXW1_9GAMM|nr:MULTISPECIES: peptide chain release factor H [Xenorhabdus]MBD2782116.1 peptide chain release factor H [Xenorhabdus sp. 38]MBD2791085.1 peptide chain release factor H [Xenorhabdus sp. CUL]MBD2805096.1 peptide chain release factor H [Xenorhabdus sp. ZM]MBD2819171.1 peptide chain release factor H [Xenorhabdus sp. 42]MBD2825287.1 peptide chain release factor H [Xenorhabdus sp. 5]